MARDWIVFDVNSVAWRVFYSLGHREPRPSIFQTILELQRLADHFNGQDLVFTFDRKPYIRRNLYASYKTTREINNKDDDESRVEDEFRCEMDSLRQTYLPDLGYKNIFSKKGYEADDIMAAVVLALPEDDRAILITDDKDLYQVLSYRAAIYHPRSKSFVTAKWFKQEYGIPPIMWNEVKSLAGCSTDDVPGMDGVGELTALKFFRQELKGTAKHDRILEYNRSQQYQLSHKLVTLPYPGLPAVTLDTEQEPRTRGALKKLCQDLELSENLLR